MNRLLILCLIAWAPIAFANDGFERYEAMGEGDLTPLIGDWWQEWTPSQRGVTGPTTVAEVPVPELIHPVDGSREPMLTAVQVESILQQFRQFSNNKPDLAKARIVSKGIVRFDDVGAEYHFHESTSRLHRYLRAAEEPVDPTGLTPVGEFSPDRKRYLYVREADLYVVDTQTGSEKRVTTRPRANATIGFLGSGPGFVWSPDSRHVVFLRASTDGQYDYPIQQHLAVKEAIEPLSYPLVDAPLPSMQYIVIDLETGQQEVVAETDGGYLRNVAWVAGGASLIYQLWDRQYNRFEIRRYVLDDSSTATIHEETSSTFLNDGHQPTVLPSGDRFVMNSERSGWNHLYLHDLDRAVHPITQGELDVDRVLLAKDGWLYFTAFTNRGLDRHLFRASLDGADQQQLTQPAGFHEPVMDPSASYFIDRHSSLDRPPRVDVFKTNGEFVRTLAETNVARVRELGLRDPQLLTLKAGDDKTALQGVLYRPADFDPSRQYPLIEYVYGGPHSKECANIYVTDNWLARLSQLGFLVWVTDARGTPRRGKAFGSAAYRRLGQVDIDDHAHVIRQLTQLPYVDGERVGIHGVSHGGFMTLHALFKHGDVYKVGVANAPLTSLQAGPMQYIEKSMGTLASNPEGYFKASPVSFVDGLSGRLLIQHGTNDRNALFTNTMLLCRALADVDKDFDLSVYPGGVHVFSGRDGSHASKRMTSYFLKHLRPAGWQDTHRRLWPTMDLD